jgi:putative transposase
MVFEVINSYKRSKYAMSEDKIIPLKNPGVPAPVADALTELRREGAQQMLAAAIEAEVAAFLERFKDEKTADGCQRVVRNGHLPTRSIETGVGAVEVTVPRVRDLCEDDPVYLGDFAAVPEADQKP